jgi:ankyrin repeat protein
LKIQLRGAGGEV